MADILTMRGMVDAIIAIDLKSVEVVYNAPPESVATPDLPALWPSLPSVASNDAVLVCDGFTGDVTMDIVIAVEPYGQDEQEVRFDFAIQLGDELRAALSTTSYQPVWDYSFHTDYEISVVTDINVGDSWYWGIRATVTARNAE